MLAQDKLILASYKEYLATESEIDQLDILVKKHVPESDFTPVVISGDRRATLARFIWQTKQVDRNENVAQRGLEALEKCISIRKEHEMDDLLRPRDPILRAFIKKYRDAAPYSFHSTTVEGYPIKFAKWGTCDIGFLEKAWKETPELVTKAELRLWEYMTQVRMARESQRQGKTVDRAIIAFDLTKLGMRHVALLKSFLGTVSMIFRQVFPETIARTVVYNTSWWIAGPLNMVKIFMHPMARGKIVIESSEPSQLSASVCNENFPSFAGGTCQCKHCLSSRMDGGLELDFANEEDDKVRSLGDGDMLPISSTSPPQSTCSGLQTSYGSSILYVKSSSACDCCLEDCDVSVDCTTDVSVQSPHSFTTKSLMSPTSTASRNKFEFAL